MEFGSTFRFEVSLVREAKYYSGNCRAARCLQRKRKKERERLMRRISRLGILLIREIRVKRRSLTLDSTTAT